jgi:polysaccharide biosynthesis transport protein
MDVKLYSDDIDFERYWLVLKRHWLTASAFASLPIIISLLIALSEKPVYQADAKILFRKRDPGSLLLAGESEKLGQLEALTQQSSPIETEAEVLRSIPLITKTIQSLNLKDKKTGDLLTPENMIKNLTAKGVKGTDVLLISYKSDNPQNAASIVNKLIQLYTDRNINLNRTEATAARTFISRELPKVSKELQDAEIAVQVFEEENNIINLSDEASSSVAALAEINKQAVGAQASLDSTNAQVTALQSILGLTVSNAHILNAISQSPSVQQVLLQLQQTENELALQRTRYYDGTVVINSLEQRRVALARLLQERIASNLRTGQALPSGNLQSSPSEQKLIEILVGAEISRQGLLSQVQSLNKAALLYQERTNLLPRLKQRHQELYRRVDRAKSSYEILVKRLQEVQIAENQNLGNARIIEMATNPNVPLPSKKKLAIGGGIVAGIFVYALTAFVLDLIDPSIKTAKEVREIFKHPWLGMIPRSKRRRGFNSSKYLDSTVELPVRDAPAALISEAYRMLRSNLRFLNPDRRPKTIVITSCVSKEGKSCVAANLALSLSQMGKKVLLVDADFHHPVQHHTWNLTNITGLSNVIMEEISLDKAVHSVHNFLTVLTSGTIPPDPLALLDSNRMVALINEITQHYDFVIFDTPPLVLVSDVLALGLRTDGILLVVRPGVIDMASAETAKDLLAQSNIEVLGIVINDIVAEYEPDNYLRHAQAYHEGSTKELLLAKEKS